MENVEYCKMGGISGDIEEPVVDVIEDEIDEIYIEDDDEDEWDDDYIVDD